MLFNSDESLLLVLDYKKQWKKLIESLRMYYTDIYARIMVAFLFAILNGTALSMCAEEGLFLFPFSFFFVDRHVDERSNNGGHNFLAD